MKKRIVCVLLIISLVSMMFVGCSSKTESTSEDTTASVTDNTTTDTTADTADSSDSSTDSGEEASYSAENPLVLKVANGVSTDNIRTILLQEFCDKLQEETEGRVTYELFPNGEIGSGEEQVEMVRTNTIQMTDVIVTLKDYQPEMYVFGLPYLFHSFDDAYDYLMNSDLAKQMWANLEEENNLKMTAIYLIDTRALTTEDVIVTCPDDLKGVKIRSMTSQVSQDTIEALGATPVPMSYSELYTALQTGVVEGQDNGMNNVYTTKFYEVQKYFYKTGHGYTIQVTYVNPEFYYSMTEEDQAIFDRLVQEVILDEYNEQLVTQVAETEAFLKEQGMIIVEQDEMDMQAFYDSADEMIQEKYMSDETYARVINDIKEYCGY